MSDVGAAGGGSGSTGGRVLGREEIGGALPDRARAWVEAAVGPGSRLVWARALPGATSSAVHGVTVVDRRGRHHELVLRRYVLLDWLEREPDLAEREAEALVIVEPSPVPTPVLVAADVDGTDLGAPGVLMTRLPGRPPAEPGPTPDQVDRLAALLPVLHATPVPPGSGVRAYRPYDQRHDLVPPPWSTDDPMWRQAIHLHRAFVAAGPVVLVHRDYHPANVLFDPSTGQVSGLVDWANASLGRPDVDVGHCRFNLVGQLGRAGADRFRDRWLAESGTDRYDPTYDVLAVVGALREWSPARYGAEPEVESFVAAALADVTP
ncbi:MAG: phosphotransferase family protein [Acidimicrobiales bacterium]